MAAKIYNVELRQAFGHWEVYVDGTFFCTADSKLEAIRELESVYDIGGW